MAKKSLIAKQKRPTKFKVQAYTRCLLCGNPRGFMQKFKVCRKCFRELALQGKLPGVRKASW